LVEWEDGEVDGVAGSVGLDFAEERGVWGRHGGGCGDAQGYEDEIVELHIVRKIALCGWSFIDILESAGPEELNLSRLNSLALVIAVPSVCAVDKWCFLAAGRFRLPALSWYIIP
jgi:hypothetical protein